jgi:hypothetical protein
MFRLFSVVCFAVIISTSCTEKIDLKLKNSEPQLVIEANVNDQAGPYYVILTKSRLYYESNQLTVVEGAVVVLSDDAGNVDSLQQILPGLYQTQSIQGSAGRTYHLQVNVDGTLYESYCKMPLPVDIDSVTLFEDRRLNGDVGTRARVYFTDPAGVRNQYRITSVRNEEDSRGFDLHRDRLWDGKQRNYEVSSSDLEPGDTIITKLLSIDERIYEYMNVIENNGFGQTAAPANPSSIYTPFALGYFSAHSIKSRTIIVP